MTDRQPCRGRQPAPLCGRRAGAASLLAALLLVAGCASAPVGPEPEGRRPDPLPAPPPQVQPIAPPQFPEGLGPEILLPDTEAHDEEVARVGDLILRQSHAYARLVTAHPKLALSAVDLLVFDVLVARHAEQFAIRVSPQRVEELALQEERELRRQVETELSGLAFADYIWRLFGMREQDWQRSLRVRTAQRLYQGYVLRYLALREDRAKVRFLVHKDREIAQDVVDKVQKGADFATLATRWSEDPSKRDGGLLPPFGRGFNHPVAQRAFALQPGDVSEAFAAEWGGQNRWFVVYCLERRPGRDVPFEAVRAEIDADLERHPVTPLETTAYTLRWRRRPDAGATTERGQ